MVITIDINSVCNSAYNSSLVLFAGDLIFFLNTINVEECKLLQFHLDAVQNRGLDKGMKQNVNKTTFTLPTVKTNGTNFSCKLDGSHIAFYRCVKDMGSIKALELHFIFV
jgi:hypothetical protein